MFEQGCTSSVSTESWERFQVDLAASILDLADRAFLVVQVARTSEERAATAPGPPGLCEVVRRKMAGTRDRNVDPFVDFLRMGQHVICEVGGPADRTGCVQLTKQQQAWILALGWGEPQPSRRQTRWPHHNYRAYFPHDGIPARIHGKPLPPDKKALDYRDLVDADRAARMAVDTLTGPLAVESPRRLQVKRSAQ